MTQQVVATPTTVTYPLNAKGYIHHWLVAGPQAIPVEDLERFDGSALKPAIAAAYHNADCMVTTSPVEATEFSVNDRHGEAAFRWQLQTCAVDHFVDHSAFYHTCHYLRSWACATVESPESVEAATLALTTNGPADVWINGKHVHRQSEFHHQLPHSVRFNADLAQGDNDIVVCFEGVAIRECPYVMALQIEDVASDNAQSNGSGPTHGWQVKHLTALPPKRRQMLEEIFNAATIERSLYHHEDEVIVYWPHTLRAAGKIGVRLQSVDGRIYAEGHPTAKAGEKVKLGKAYTRPDGRYWITLMPDPEEYYVHNVRMLRRIPIWITNGKFSTTTTGTYPERARDALVAATVHSNLYSEIAKMALGQWGKLKLSIWTDMITRLNQRVDCSDFYLVGMLGALSRFGGDPNFPAELKEPILDCALNFRYWMDEPGEDAMCFWSENHQILFHACEVLAGQLLPESTFTNAGENGTWHREKGERLALNWLRKRAAGGFREWDSNTYFEHDVLALTHLADLAENEEVAEMAAIVLDKLLFTMAVNSFQGVFGSTHGRTYTPYIKGGRLEPTSGIARLLWGVGVYNEHVLGTVALACATGYQLPPAIFEIGATPVEEMWAKERHAGTLEQACDCAEGEWAVDKVTYKTADYMLASAQDYQPGTPGYQQHIWQATFGPDAVVFTTHPPCVSEDGSHRPNFWHGNVVLPRVVQWKDTLLALYNLPAEDWLGFTHAYFPTVHFDEHRLRDGWAFARKGDGYLALTASCGIDLVANGGGAKEELRSHGQQNVWICQMGRAAQDGTFEEFQAKVLATTITVDGLSVAAETMRGNKLAFGWDAALTVDGVEEAIAGFQHYENPFSTCELGAAEMVIRSWNHAMQLDFTA